MAVVSRVEKGFLEAAIDQRDVLAALSALAAPVALTPLAEFAAASGIRSLASARAPSTRELNAWLSDWEAAGWVIFDGSRQALYGCTDGIAHAALADAAARGSLSGIAAAIERLYPARKRYYYDAARWLYRDARLELYLGNEKAALAHAREAALQREYEPSWAERSFSLAETFGYDAPVAALAMLPAPLAEAYVAVVLQVAVESLRPLSAAALSLARRISSTNEALVHWGILFGLLRGDPALCLHFSEGRAELEAALGQAFASWAGDELELARQQAALALQLSQVPKARRKVRLSGPLEPWVCLLLSTSGDPKHRLLALEMSERNHQRSARAELICNLCGAFVDTLKRATPPPSFGLEVARHGFRIDHGNWDTAIVSRLIGLWLDKVPAAANESFVASAKGLLARTKRDGYGWLAAQLGDLSTAICKPEEPHRGLAALYRTLAPWEQALEALSSAVLQAKPADAATEAVTRLVWLVSLANETSGDSGLDDDDDDDDNEWLWRMRASGLRPPALGLGAKRQRRRGKGWTSGSAVSNAKLKQALENGELDEADRRIVEFLWPDPQRSAGLDFEEGVGLALIGHPLLFWQEDGTPAEALRAEPTVQVLHEEGGLRLSFVPRLDGRASGKRLAYARDGERLLVYPLNALHHDVAAALSKGISVPTEAEAQGRLQRALGQLSGLVHVQSAVGVEGGDAEQVEADRRLVLQLKRAALGLQLRLRVFPLGEGGPELVPGHGAASVVARIAGTTRQAERDLEAERQRLDALLAACPSLPPIESLNGTVSIPDPLDCYELLSQLAGLDDSLVTVMWPEGEPLQVVAERDVRDLRLRLRRKDEWLVAEGTVEVEEGLVLDLADLLGRLDHREGRFIPLEKGKLLGLSERLLRRLSELRDLARSGKRKAVELHPLAIFGLKRWGEAEGPLRADKAVQDQLDRFAEAGTLKPRVPQTFKASLRDYQQEGFVWLSRLAHWGAGACLADDMGLGKTVQVLAVLLARAELGPALVVAPTSVCPTWFEQAARFCPTLRLLRYGEGERSTLLAEAGPSDVLVASYGLVTGDIEAFAAKRFATAVLDEAQAIKNASAQRTKAMMRLGADFRIITTGTPVENHLGELWSEMSFLNPGLLGSARQFEQRFARPIQREGDKASAQRLRQLLRPFMLRRTKAQVLDELPPKTEHVVRVHQEPDERALYEAIRRQALERTDERGADGQQRFRLLGELMRLRRAACHPRLVLPDSALSSAKLEALFELLDELRGGGHQALVFSQFVDHLTIVRERLDAEGISYQYLDGSTPPKKRESAVTAFQRGEGQVFLISLRAGGFGLNLTAADYVIHLDPWWNPAVEDQASDRAHRIGQTRPVTIYKLVGEDTIEERILEMHGEKRELATQLLAGTEASTSLSIDQLRELLKLA